jgi:probable HAF family extracellular repeat protein
MKRLVVLAAALSACASAAYAQFNYCTIDYPAGFGTYARGINSSGEIIGSYNDENGNLHALLIQNDTFIPLAPSSVLGTEYSDAYKINDQGQVVGEECDSAGCHGFLYSNGVVTLLNFPGADDTFAWGINNSGEVVGWWQTAPDVNNDVFYHGFKWSNGKFKELTYPRSGDTYATGNNDFSAIVGGWDSGVTATSEQGFVNWFGQNYNLVAPFPGVAYTQPNGINDFGLMVGEEYTPAEWQSGDGHGFLSIDGYYFAQLNYPDAVGGTTAWGINTQGDMVGNWYDALGGVHGWLVQPRSTTCPTFQTQGTGGTSGGSVVPPVKPAATFAGSAAISASPVTKRGNQSERSPAPLQR